VKPKLNAAIQLRGPNTLTNFAIPTPSTVISGYNFSDESHHKLNRRLLCFGVLNLRLFHTQQHIWLPKFSTGFSCWYFPFEIWCKFLIYKYWVYKINIYIFSDFCPPFMGVVMVSVTAEQIGNPGHGREVQAADVGSSAVWWSDLLFWRSVCATFGSPAEGWVTSCTFGGSLVLQVGSCGSRLRQCQDRQTAELEIWRASHDFWAPSERQCNAIGDLQGCAGERRCDLLGFFFWFLGWGYFRYINIVF
jgi:hypothetical protein